MLSGGLRYSSASSPFYALLVRRCPFYAVEDFEHAQNLERTRNVQNFRYLCVPSPVVMRFIRYVCVLPISYALIISPSQTSPDSANGEGTERKAVRISRTEK